MTVPVVALLIWDMFLLAGTAYLVEKKGWSPWWFAFALLLLAYPSK